MTIEERALNFAINAHRGQVRKSEPDKPMIFHPINVGHILKEYGYDENVVASGFLHDVVEDTKYTFEDIKSKFGDDIESLVYGASEPDKSLSWEDRKKHTIDSIKSLDDRHKAVICADKISNLEDLLFLFSRIGKYDFSAFKKGFESQQWYYTSVLECLKENIDQENPMINKLDNLLQKVFYNGDIDIEIRNNYFNSDDVRYNQIKRLNHQKEELLKLKGFMNDPDSYLIEVSDVASDEIIKILTDLNQFPDSNQYKISFMNKINQNEITDNENDILIINKKISIEKNQIHNESNTTFISVKPDNDMENIPIDTTKKMLELVRSDYIMKLKKEYRSE